MNDSNEDTDDPRIAQALRLGELRKEVMDRVEGPSFEGGTENLSMPAQEQFWQHVLAFEKAGQTTTEARLREEAKFVPRDPDTLTEPKELDHALWQLLHALASIRIFVHFTDHLSDADLYRLLVKGALPDETPALPPELEINTRIDATEYGTADDPDGTDTWLRYYADDHNRAQWDGPVPPKSPPPYSRDRLLPDPPESHK